MEFILLLIKSFIIIKIFNQNTEKIKGQIVYKDIDIKKDINLPFSIPKDYERMD